MKNTISQIFKSLILKSSVLILISVINTSCKCDYETSDRELGDIRGIVIEEYSGNPIPFAYVGVKMDVFVDLWNSQEYIVDTLQADADGKFILDRAKYLELSEENLGATFFACADGPYQNGIDVYEDNCAEGGSSIIPSVSKDITVEVYTIGWVRFFIEDSGEANPEITNVIINELWPGGPSFGYPFGYDHEQGYSVAMRGFQDISIEVVLATWADGIEGNDISLDYPVFVMGKDTVEVVIEY
jgi:hypothetical protein